MSSSIRLESTPTPLQSQIDAFVGGFVGQVTQWRSMAAMTAGGLAYRAGSLGILSAGTGLRTFLPLFSAAGGLATEASVFELTHRALVSNFRFQISNSQPENPNLWRWSGPGGIKQGFLQSLVSFGALRSAGRLAQGQNLPLQHLLQDTGMVAGHQVLGRLDLSYRPTGSLAEQFLHAEATTLQMGAAMALSHGFAPGIHSLERGLDVALHFRTAPFDPPNTEPRWNFAHAAIGPSSRSHFPSSRPIPNVLLSKSLNEGEFAELSRGAGNFWERRRELDSRLEAFDRALERQRNAEELSAEEKALFNDPKILELKREREIKDLAREDLIHFADPPSQVGSIPGLRRELEKLYWEGVEVYATRGDEPFSLSNYSTKPLTQEDYRAFQSWQTLASLPSGSEPRSLLNGGMRGLRTFLDKKSMALEGEASPYEAHYLLSLLEMLPQSFYGSDYLWALTLGSNRDLTDSRYNSGDVEIHLGEVTLGGSPREPLNRRQLMGVLYHELGHSVAARYAIHREGNYTDDSKEHLPPDSRIPLKVRQKMQRSFDTIRGTRQSSQNFVFSLGFIESADRRRQFISNRERPYVIREFISDFVLYYVAAGDAMWNHFSTINNPAVREAYHWIYQEMRDRIFEGNEYSGGYQTGKVPAPPQNGHR